uniref:NADH-ubiquinone oxidoreductase chain 3 n=1 Tax=Apalacris nigrogeniculata TaxID=335052 RepID=A0A6G6A5H2_9ORTH|nr:NADH dehydrogenase subunit 3 [Apalacris nigrogeniculata]YP_010703642.1 NADH dehydrogenase subunit 3 [Xenocatantops humilis]QID03453.1 NADH dehydrogenase subunit 3 [Apalacris nigrogeniculata]WCO86776.1 NADH dehydrogenase subunit 3 [Xenocatantops humilis]
MTTVYMTISTSFILSSIIMMMATIMAKKTINDREKSSPFECGFDPKSSARMPFSIQFFLIAMIFLIFDVEIAMIMPIVIIFKSSNIMVWTSSTLMFIMILLGGLYYEWNQGALKWAD